MFRWLAASSLFLIAAAYKDTIPIVAWSSQLNHDLKTLSLRPKSYSSPADLFHQFLEVDDDGICKFDTVIIADQPGLSAADLKTSSYLIAQLSAAPSSLQIPYLPLSDNEPKTFEAFKEAIVTKCGSERKEISLGSRSSRSRNHDGPHQVVGISMPPLDSSNGKMRRETFTESQYQLEKTIKEQTSSSSSHLIIYTSSVSARMESGFNKEAENLHLLPIHADVADFATVAINSTLPTGSLLQRYQFFTPGILIGFFIGFVIILPIVLLGFYAVASIQTPSRMDSVGSRTITLDKKNQ